MDKRIAIKAKELFLKYGYTRVTLSEVAQEIGISKKTIYNHYEGKQDLLFKVMDMSKEEFESQISTIEQKENLEFQDMILEILTMLGMWVSQFRTFTKDLKTNQTEAFDYMIKIRRDLILSHAMRIMTIGKENGILSEEEDSSMALFLFLAAAEKVTDEDYKNNLPSELTKGLPGNPTEIFKNIVQLIYKGLKK